MRLLFAATVVGFLAAFFTLESNAYVQETWTYPTTILRVVDADTMDVEFKQGLGSLFRTRVRIKDYDAPETWRPCNDIEEMHGHAATQFAKEILPETIKGVVYGWGVYNRVEVTFLYPDDRTFSDIMVENGFSKRDSYDPDDESC